LISILQIIPIRVANASSQYIIEFTKIREGIYRVNGKTYYDDFNDGVLNASLWNVSLSANGGAYTEEDGVLKINATTLQWTGAGLRSVEPRIGNGVWTIIHDFYVRNATSFESGTVILQTGWGNNTVSNSGDPDIGVICKGRVIAFHYWATDYYFGNTTFTWYLQNWYRLVFMVNFTSGELIALIINLTDGKVYIRMQNIITEDLTPYTLVRLIPHSAIADNPFEVDYDNLMVVSGTYNITIVGDPDLSQVSKIELYDTTDKLYASVTLTGTEKQVEFYPANLTYPLDGYFKFYDKYGNLIGRAPSSGYMRIWAGDIFKLKIVDVTTWVYKREITITERSGNNLTDYPVLVTFNATPMILEGKIRADLADLRFSNGTSLLPYFIESISNITLVYENNTKHEISIYAKVGDCIYGGFWIPVPSILFKYNLTSKTLTVLYQDSTNRFTLWQGVYNKTEGKIYCAGQYFDGTYYRSTIFIINVTDDTVTYVRHPQTGDINEFIGIAEYGNYLFIGERAKGGLTGGSIYPDGSGIWRIPKSTILDYTTWERIWEEAGSDGIKRLAVAHGKLYAITNIGELYVYDGNTFTLLYNFSPYLATVKLADISSDGDYLYIYASNSSTSTLHILKYDGSSLVDYDTGAKFMDYVLMGKTIVLGRGVLHIAIAGTQSHNLTYAYIGTPYKMYKAYVWGTGVLASLGGFVIDGSKLYVGVMTTNLTQIWRFDLGIVKAWVKVPFIPASGQITIDMLYGNPSATDESNASKVFEWYDDFSDTVDLTQYNALPSGQWTVEEGCLVFHPQSVKPNNKGNITIPISAIKNFAVETSFKFPLNTPGTSVGWWFNLMYRFIDASNQWRLNVKSWERVNTYGQTPELGKNVAGVYTKVANYSQYYLRSDLTNIEIDVYETSHKIYWECYSASTYKFLNISVTDADVNQAGSIILHFSMDISDPYTRGGIGYIEFVRVRKYVDPEPMVSVGSEIYAEVHIFNIIKEVTYIPLNATVLNATTKAKIFSRVSIGRIPLPTTVGNYILIIYYAGMPIFNKTISVTSIPFETNITVNIISKIDYRNLKKVIFCNAPQTLKLVEDLNPKLPYSRVKVLVNGTGDFTLVYFLNQTPTNVNVIANISVVYNIKDSYLYINGTLHSTAEIIVEDQYLLSVAIKDRLGYYLANHPITINGSKYPSNQLGYVKAYLVPEDYLLDFPTYRGFEFYRADSTTTKPIHVRLTTDKSLTAEFLVPSSFAEVSIEKVFSLFDYLKGLLQGGDENVTTVKVTGFLKDYYGDGIASRTVYINVTDTDTGAVVTMLATTDSSGYFESDTVSLFAGKDYRIDISFEGDDIYTSALYSTLYSVPKAVAPAPVGIPYYYYIIIIALVVILIIGIFMVFRVSKASLLRPRRYLKIR